MSDSTTVAGVAYAGPTTYWPERTYYGLTGRTWLKIGIVGVLLIGIFWPNLRRLWFKTNPVNGEANWGHAFFVPLIGIYYLYLNREALMKTRIRPAWSGLMIMLAGLAMYSFGIWPGQNDFVKDVGMVVTLFGASATLMGWRMMSIVWFPIVFLLCALPWPGLAYSKIAMPLQKLAASVAVGAMRLFGIEALNEGTQLVIGVGQDQRRLNVAEACAGLKSLMTFVTVGAAVGFLSSRALWQKIVITLSAVPIAIFCNVMRVAGQGFLDRWDPKLSESFAHQFVGLIMLIPAFFLILLVAWIMDNLFVEQIDRRQAALKRKKQSEGQAAEATKYAAAPAKVGEPAAAASGSAAAAAATTSAGSASSPIEEEDALAAATRKLMAASARPRKPRSAPSGQQANPAVANAEAQSAPGTPPVDAKNS